MNEKIKQLLLDAGGQYSSGNQNDWPSWVLGDAVVTKFAELIVRECMTICKEHPSRIVSNNWVADAVAPDIVSQFEEHFGVEE